MARVGVLSDLAVKYRYPEMFPIDIGGQEMMHPIHLQKNMFKGVKPSKRGKRYTDIARYPINDLKNFAQFGSAGREKEAQFYAIQNYRQELGSNNVMPHLETAFKARNTAGYTPAPMFSPENGAGGVQPPATLSLGKISRKIGQDLVSQKVPGTRSFLSARMRAAIANVVEDDADIPVLVNTLLPGIPSRLSDEDAISRFSHLYRDVPHQLSVFERAYHNAGRQEIPTIPTQREDIGEEAGEED
jgi:hypothetical protein